MLRLPVLDLFMAWLCFVLLFVVTGFLRAELSKPYLQKPLKIGALFMVVALLVVLCFCSFVHLAALTWRNT